MEAPLLPGFNLDQNFFGLKAKDRPHLHSNLFDMLWLGEGKWDWDTLYNMPIFLRNFFIKKLEKIFDDRAKALEKQQNSNTSRKKIEKGPF